MTSEKRFWRAGLAKVGFQRHADGIGPAWWHPRLQGQARKEQAVAKKIDGLKGGKSNAPSWRQAHRNHMQIQVVFSFGWLQAHTAEPSVGESTKTASSTTKQFPAIATCQYQKPPFPQALCPNPIWNDPGCCKNQCKKTIYWPHLSDWSSIRRQEFAFMIAFKEQIGTPNKTGQDNSTF